MNYGFFYGYGNYTNFWMSREYSADNSYNMNLYSIYSNVSFSMYGKVEGYCVRCVKDIAVGVDDRNKSELPKEFFLLQNYPNPFNPQTKISYSVPKESFITLKVYDLLGREVATLVNEKKPVGEYSVPWNADNVPSGIYFYKLSAGDFIQTKKMILMK